MSPPSLSSTSLSSLPLSLPLPLPLSFPLPPSSLPSPSPLPLPLPLLLPRYSPSPSPSPSPSTLYTLHTQDSTRYERDPRYSACRLSALVLTTHSLTPSLPHSLTPSLPHSLTPSLTNTIGHPKPHGECKNDGRTSILNGLIVRTVRYTTPALSPPSSHSISLSILPFLSWFPTMRESKLEECDG